MQRPTIMKRKGLFLVWIGWRFQMDIRWQRGERVSFYVNLNR